MFVKAPGRPAGLERVRFSTVLRNSSTLALKGAVPLDKGLISM